MSKYHVMWQCNIWF